MTSPKATDARTRLSISRDEVNDWQSSAFNALLRQALRFARTDGTLLLEGESGTGKTRLARYLHDHSPRAKHPFHTLSLAAVEDSLASSELFGHKKGAFTDAKYARSGAFQVADSGTLFLDEIGKASIAVQRKLLVAIESQQITPVGSDRSVHTDVRLILASNISLRPLVESGAMLPDLAPRLGAFTLRLPSLRERREDIPLLVHDMVNRHTCRGRLSEAPSVDEALMRALRRADWPNNLRQLDATIHRIVVDAEGAPVLTLDHCLDDLAYLRELGTPARRVSTERVAQAVSAERSRATVAKELGISEATLYRRLRADRAMSSRAPGMARNDSVTPSRNTLNGTERQLAHDS